MIECIFIEIINWEDFGTMGDHLELKVVGISDCSRVLVEEIHIPDPHLLVAAPSLLIIHDILILVGKIPPCSHYWTIHSWTAAEQDGGRIQC